MLNGKRHESASYAHQEEVAMNVTRSFVVESPVGKSQIDQEGSPVGVVRMDPEKSYVGVGELIEAYINRRDEEAWEKIRSKIDYTYEALDLGLTPLETRTRFGAEIKSRMGKGQKLLFKPNLVNPHCIDPQTHQPGLGTTACTEWAFIAALMRWFHDKLGIRYHQMALGEAATAIPSAAAQYTMLQGGAKTITPEAVIEGKCGDFYGGWGFYFARKYLAQTLSPDATDDPMSGYEDSAAGTYIPMGEAEGKLMVYDLNRIYDDPAKRREIQVPDGVNFKAITLHKAVVGGNPDAQDDIRANPGVVLVNVPKLKVHAMTLFTNAIKNLGIGLYPMQYASKGGNQWDYAIPKGKVPGIKGAIPHQVWDAEMDEQTGLPKMDGAGKIVLRKTGGLTATMLDILKGGSSQGIFMLHVVDAVEAVNIDHQGIGMGTKEKEGMVFAGLDMVATDLLCARYMFSNIPMNEALEVGLEDGHGGLFAQRVPVPCLEGNNIVTQPGYDCPLARDRVFENAERRGLGQRKYYVVGHDSVTDSPLATLQGHLGAIQNGTFSDVTTHGLYFDAFCLPWGLQKTCLSYMEAVDRLTGSKLKQDFLAAFDEDKDGVITFEEFGTNGQHGILLYLGGDFLSKVASEKLGYLKSRFKMYARLIKNADPRMNRNGYRFLAEHQLGAVCLTAFAMSKMNESPDLFVPGMTWGNGKWPSFQLAQFAYLGSCLYGQGFPNRISPMSLYGQALFYADLTQDKGTYAGELINRFDPKSVSRYVSDVKNSIRSPMDFTLFVPLGFDCIGGTRVPNVEATADPAKVVTVSFARGKEIWPEERL
jgi:hypothetical protein